MKGKFALEATSAQTVDSNTGAITINNVTYGSLKYTGTKYGKHSCSESCETITLKVPIAKKASDTGVPYVYRKYQGNVIAEGNHETLINTSDTYKNFYTKQLRKD